MQQQQQILQQQQVQQQTQVPQMYMHQSDSNLSAASCPSSGGGSDEHPSHSSEQVGITNCSTVCCMFCYMLVWKWFRRKSAAIWWSRSLARCEYPFGIKWSLIKFEAKFWNLLVLTAIDVCLSMRIGQSMGFHCMLADAYILSFFLFQWSFNLNIFCFAHILYIYLCHVDAIFMWIILFQGTR